MMVRRDDVVNGGHGCDPGGPRLWFVAAPDVRVSSASRGGPVRLRGFAIVLSRATVLGGAAQMFVALILVKTGELLMHRSSAVVRLRRGFMRSGAELGRLLGGLTGSVEVLAGDAYLLDARAACLTDVGLDVLAAPRQLVDAFVQLVSTLAGVRSAALATVGGVLAHDAQRSRG
jgi:hypothetical protein